MIKSGSARGFHARVLSGGVTRILTGSVVGQGSLLAVSPLLTRLYSPADFGALAVFTAVASVLGGVSSLSWERAIVVPRSPAQAEALSWLAIGTISAFSTALVPISFFVAPSVDHIFGTRVFQDLWWLMPVTVLIMGFYSVVSAWLVRKQRFGSLAVRNVIQGLSQSVSSVAFGLLGAGPIGLLSSIAVGRAASVFGVVQWRGLTRKTRPSRGRLFATARRFRRFPLISTWSSALNSLGLQLPPILIVALYGSVEAGLYALTLRVLAAPVGIIVSAVSQYFEGAFASRVRLRLGSLTSLLVTTSMRLLIVALLPATIVVIFGPELFAIIFGAEWRTAGEFAQITVVSYVVQFAVSPVSKTLIVLELQVTQFLWDVARMASTVFATVGTFMLGGSITMALIVLSVFQVILYGILFWLCLRGVERALLET